ncbi:MAG: hypothetical protein HQK49_02935 [Oligoflexia bacterium]|nr:hypothetical protein [Oligoflexia bacterium]
MAVGAGYISYRYYISPTQTIPYPYFFPEKEVTNFTSELNPDDLPQILVIGDRLGKNLKNFTDKLAESLANETRATIKISVLAENNEGLHRTIYRLKRLKLLPPVIIYNGGTQELFEKKFHIREANKILSNIKTYQDDKVKTLLQLVPVLSKFIYHPLDRVKLKSEPYEDTSEYAAQERGQRMEISYKLYEMEMEELIQYVSSKGKNLILINVPINFSIYPKVVCENSSSDNIIKLQNEYFELLKNENYKDAYNGLIELKNIMPGNALTYFMLGKACKNIGKFKEAVENFELSSSYDCSIWRGNAIHNAIIERYAQKYNLPLLDFHLIVNKDFAQEDNLFLDEILPQHTYYQKLMEDLKKQLKKSLNI